MAWNNTSASEMHLNAKFGGVDIFKFICAILVVVIHIEPFSKYNLGFSQTANFVLQQIISRVAVPFYFTASGFLLFRKTSLIDPDSQLVKGFCFKILRLLGTWTFLLFVGSKGQLWYMGAVVLAVFIIYSFFKKGIRLKAVLSISFVLYVVGLFGDSYFGLFDLLKSYVPGVGAMAKVYDSLFVTTRNGVFFGLVFVCMGALFAHRKIVLNKLTVIIGIVISEAALFAEVFLLNRFTYPKDDYNMMLSLIPLTFFVFYASLHIDIKNEVLSKKLRIWGALIFYLHLIVLYFVNMVFGFIKGHFSADLAVLVFPAVVAITLFLSIIIEKISNTKRFRFVKYIYS